jgi:hypothetical protein
MRLDGRVETRVGITGIVGTAGFTARADDFARFD